MRKYRAMGHGIEVTSLTKQFRVRKQNIIAINDISFAINKGERVAFTGPNGAGKSTTIKILTGILHPTSGEARVLGMVPWKQRRTLGFEIGTVFGQRSQLWYHLPPQDAFDLLSKIYELHREDYQKQLKHLIEVFEIGDFLHRPVRKLSLGQRMRCELVASLLHNPKMLFLDEPTVGLDVTAKLKIRNLLNYISNEQGTTLFLTSHDTADIEQVCERVIVLDRGKILRDCPLGRLRSEYVKRKIVTLKSDQKELSLGLSGIEVLENSNYIFKCEVDLKSIPIDEVIHAALKKCSVKDITIEDPTMEEIIRNIYE